MQDQKASKSECWSWSKYHIQRFGGNKMGGQIYSSLLLWKNALNVLKLTECSVLIEKEMEEEVASSMKSANSSFFNTIS